MLLGLVIRFIFKDWYGCTYLWVSVYISHLNISSSHEAVVYNINAHIDSLPYLPTPPLGQDMTQGQFLSGV